MKRSIVVLFLVLAACAREEVVESQTSATSATTETTATTATTPTATTDTSTTRPPGDSTTPPSVTGPKLQFVDEASKDPTFAAYRDQLLAAVRARDAKKVLELSDPNIRLSFGGTGGRAAFEKALKEEIWGELEQILTLGGGFREGMFWAPYVYSAWPESQDAFEYLAVVGDDVPLRASPDTSAPVIATLSRDLVKREGQPNPWQKVTTADGKTGYVETKSVRSPVGYRAGLAKSKDGWRMQALVAGD